MLVLITASSSCACTSINPGATVRPVASISRAASPSIAPTAAMRPSRTATSARNASVPLPSITLPLRMWRSNSGMVARTVSSMSPARQRVSGERRSLDVSRSFRASGVRPSGTGGGGEASQVSVQTENPGLKRSDISPLHGTFRHTYTPRQRSPLIKGASCPRTARCLRC